MLATAAMKCAGESHPGRERVNNEDRFYLDPQLGIFLIVDGVGGQAAGEVAADTAVRVLRARLERQIGAARDRLIEGVTLANNEIHRLAQESEDWAGMACVLTAALIEGGVVTIAHVGDTRLYKIRDLLIKKITPDHSPIGELEDAGRISEIEAMRHPRRNEVLRDVGSSPHTPDDEGFIEIIQIPFEPDCALLMCSDGLSDLITSEQMFQVIKQNAGSRSRTVRQLIKAANEAGGRDNITALLIEGEQFAAGVRQRPLNRPRSATHLEQSATPSNHAQPSTQRQSRKGRGLPLRILASRWTLLLVGILSGIVLVNFRQELMVRSPKPIGPAGKMYFVSKAVSGELGSINQAIKKAKAGDTIIVAPGDYQGSILLKDGVTLISQIPRQAIIRLGADSPQNTAAVVADKISSGRLTGFKIDGAPSPLGIGLLIIDSNFEVDDLEISGASSAGVEIRGASTATLRTNYIHDNYGSGLVVSDKATPHIIHNQIVNNGLQTPIARPEIAIKGARPELFWNVISGDGVDAIDGLAIELRGKVRDRNFFQPRRSLQQLPQSSVTAEPRP